MGSHVDLMLNMNKFSMLDLFVTLGINSTEVKESLEETWSTNGKKMLLFKLLFINFSEKL